MSEYDLGKEETRKHAIGTGIGALVGGVIGGYPGMQIGMAIGGFLFKPSQPKKKDYYNTDYKVFRSKIDPVPDVIGTDMCPGKIIWVNKSTLGVYNSNDLPSMGNSINATAWKEFINIMASAKIAQWAEFAVNFSGQYYNYGTHEYQIGVIRFNDKPCWFWLMLSDMFENYDNPLSPYNPLTHLDGGQDYWFQEINVETLINQPVKHNTIMYFKGFIADFTALQTNPSTSNMTIDVENVSAMNPGQFQINRLSDFPTFSAEINRDEVFLSPESMQGGATLPTYSWWYESDEDPIGYSIVPSYWYGCRDARNKMFYGLSNTVTPIYIDPAERTWKFAGNNSGSMNETVIKNWFLNNITNKTPNYYHPVLQATDVIDNRAYMCVWKNFYEPWQGRGVNGIDRYLHHHANYGIKFDIYYHDLDDPEYKVHSLLYDEEFSLSENESSSPSILFSSMVVSADSIYIFGSKVNTDIIFYDYRTIVSGDNSYTKIYGDFSAYPDDYWKDFYAALQQESYLIWRKITNQTSTYIEVEKEFAAFPSVGEVVMVSKYPHHVAEFTIAGEGSTKTKIICNPPGISPWAEGGQQWQIVTVIGVGNANISSIDGTVVNLSQTLNRAPYPGERIIFRIYPTYYDDDFTDPYTNVSPIDYSDTLINDLGFSSSDPVWPYRVSNLFYVDLNLTHHICLKINKSTGAIQLLDMQRTVTPIAYGTARLFTANKITVYPVATDKQAFVYSHQSGYPNFKSAYTYIIDFASGEIEEQVSRWNQKSGGYPPLWSYYGVTSVKEWNSTTEQYEDSWYSILYCFDSYGGLNDALKQGIYFLKLGEGKFSNKQVVSDNITLEKGLDINRRGIQKLLYRRATSTDPGYMVFSMELGMFQDENSYKIGKYGIRDHIYFYINRSNSNYFWYGRSEMWKFIPPSETNPSGELYMVTKYPIEVNNIKYQWNRIGAAGTFQHTNAGFYGNGTGLWYHCDESPPKIIYNFWEYYTDPRYISENLTNKLNYSDANTIANKLIDTTIKMPWGEIELKERRFQFSQCYDQPIKMHDVINDILGTCQGFISPCNWPSSKLYKIIIPNQDEEPVAYFGKDSVQFESNQLSDNKARIYADFSAYPDDYWKGDVIDFGEVMDHAAPYPDSQTNVIIGQTSTYITLGINLQNYWPDEKEFTLIKDNIKEGSFTFAEKSYMDRPNKVRIEFKNRLLDYAKDTVEAEDTYRLDILGEPEKIDFYKMHGIKRITQAARIAQRILDQWNYQKYTCAFETDIMGMTLCMGEIIGVTHEITGWQSKWFRIISIEELMDFEVKMELEEFNPSCYHDYGVPVINTSGYGGLPVPYVPGNVLNFEIKEDIETGKLYFTFNEPYNDSGFFVGARIYRKVGTEYEFIAIINETVSSVKLDQDVGVNDTVIYYDPDTILGSFPSQGILWIENELIYYHGIDTANNAFTNVIRGWNDTDIVEHLVEDDINLKLKFDATLGYEVPLDWVGTTQTFKASAFTIHGLTIGVDLSPSTDIDIIGYGLLPYFPESIHIPISELPELEYIFEYFGLSGNIDEIEKIIESIGLGDSKIVSETLAQIIEDLGLDDTKSVSETLAQIQESLGLNEDATVSETLTALFESIGLGDILSVVETVQVLLTQVSLEALTLGNPKVRITQNSLEILTLGDPKVKVTQTSLEVLTIIEE